ncbi:MAG: RNA-binding protein [Chloroflexi bacterium]|nr:RNA-binding protein [Chloroflexota bacterium]
MPKELLVAGLPEDATEDDIKEVFSRIAPPLAVNIVRDKETGKSQGYAIVDMATEDQGASAITWLNETAMIRGKLITVGAHRPGKEGYEHGPHREHHGR